MELHGSAEQLAALRDDDAFQRLIADASLVVDDLTLVDGMTDAAIAQQTGSSATRSRRCDRRTDPQAAPQPDRALAGAPG
jgi:hypothetical protein